MVHHKYKNRDKKTGFTLIELLVAATIVIVLTAIGVVSFVNAGRTARNGKRAADIESVRQALVLYRSDIGSYPAGTNYATMADALITAGYLSGPRPTDPKTGQPGFGYAYNGSVSAFCLCGLTEDVGDNNGNSSSTASSTSCSFGTGDYYCAENP